MNFGCNKILVMLKCFDQTYYEFTKYMHDTLV